MRIASRGLIAIVWVAFGFISFTHADADSSHKPVMQINAYDLANAVNALRTAHGLAPYSLNSTLMFTAQSQADFMAATGQVTHSGPGGSTSTQRLLAAGYPLDGDLSLGGFRAENITSGLESMSPDSAVQAWMGDALHQETMLSPYLTEIGAGVASANGRVYLVIDCARPTDASAAPSPDTLVFESGTSPPAGDVPIPPMPLSTPNLNGEVVHEVKFGETLWQIAISYGVKIDDIKRLNGLSDDNIYPGNKLLIKIEVTPILSSSTATAISVPDLTVTNTSSATASPFASPAMLSTPHGTPRASNVRSWALGIIALAIVGAVAVAWLGAGSDNSKS